jgi:hemerythrin-like domain-containing protein
MKTAINVLRGEHRSITVVLQALKQLADALQDASLQPEFPVLHAMLDYIEQYPERLHHPKEERYLFARLEARAPEATPLIDALRAEHEWGAEQLAGLRRALARVEIGWSGARADFRKALDDYREFQGLHMRKEERELLPLAERCLGAEDWREIDAAFAGNDDPIADLREEDFDRLFSRIVCLAPEPIGLAKAWRRVSA